MTSDSARDMAVSPPRPARISRRRRMAWARPESIRRWPPGVGLVRWSVDRCRRNETTELSRRFSRRLRATKWTAR